MQHARECKFQKYSSLTSHELAVARKVQDKIHLARVDSICNLEVDHVTTTPVIGSLIKRALECDDSSKFEAYAYNVGMLSTPITAPHLFR